MSSIPGQRREAAELRRAGKITAAGKTLLAAGLPLEAATLFADAGRFEQALAAILLASPSRSIEDLEPDLLLRAAEWLEALKRYGDAARAYRLLGDEGRARMLEAQARPSVKPGPAAPPRAPASLRSPRFDARSEPDDDDGRSSSLPPERVSSLPVDRVSSLPHERAPSLPAERASSLPVERVSSLPAERASSLPVERVSSVPAERGSASHGERGPERFVPSAEPARRSSWPPQPTRASSPPPAQQAVVLPPRPNPGPEKRSDAAARSLDAAVAAERAGDIARAAELYLAAGAPIGAVRCFMTRGELPRALAAIVKVPPSDPQYRKAVVLGVDLSTRLGSLDFQFDQFAAPFFETEPRDEDEVNAFYRMGLLFEKFEHIDEARALLRRVLAVRNAAAIRERLAALEARAEQAKASFARAMEEEEAQRRKSSTPPGAKPPDEETFPSLPEIQLPIRSRRPPALAESPRAASPMPRKAERPTEPENRDSPIVNVFNIAEGILIARRYKIERLLGRGGMGAVYRAIDLELDEPLAIKLFAHGRDDATLVSRFKQELSLARQISHPNVIRLYDFGQQGAIPFITMELLSGTDLAAEMERGRDLLRDLGWLIQACRGLQCVHERGVVHRDLKPENLFVTDDGVVKLMDFGIAKRQSTPANLTQQGFTAGTPAYMAPEQAENFATATHLSDIYSVGIMAYRMFTGVLPFENENPMAVLIKHIQEIPVPPRDHDPAIPDELEYLILQLLEKKPELRVQSCAELADDLERLKSRLEATASRRAK